MGIFERLKARWSPARDASGHAEDARFRTLFDNSVTGLALHTVVLDEAGGPVDYVFDDVNPAFTRITGLEPERVLGHRASEVLPYVIEEGLVREFGRVARTGEPARFRRYSTGLNRHFDYAVFSWEPGRFVVSFMDVTDEVRRELEHVRLARAIEQLGEIVLITDAEGIIEYVNPAFERITGYTREEVAGRTPRFLKSGQQPASFYVDLWETISRGETWSGTLLNRRKDGSLYRQEALISPVRDTNGRIANYVNVARDVTRVVELEEQLRQSQKLEAVGSFTGGIAHDLNNILSVIAANADLLVHSLQGGDETLLVGASDIRSASARAAKMIKQLLGFSRKAALDRRPTLLPSLVGELSSLVSRLLPETIDVRIGAAGRVPPVLADPGAVEQMVVNLVTNARDAMPSGGVLKIEVGTDTRSEAQLAGHPTARPGRYVWISVSDSGQGIDEHARSHLFEPFFTTKEPGRGTGLGLAVTYGLMQQHEGFIEVDSRPGQGARMSLWFPGIAVDVAEHVGGEDEASTPAGSGQVILVVEDEASLRRTARRVLERYGYRVLTATDGKEALELVQMHGDRLRLVLSDVVMPGMGGPELLAALRAAGYATPVILTSGHSSEGDRGELRIPEDQAFLAKPWNVSDLLRKVQAALSNGKKTAPSSRPTSG